MRRVICQMKGDWPTVSVQPREVFPGTTVYTQTETEDESQTDDV